MITKVLAAFALLSSALASPLLEKRACSDDYRAAELNGVASAFSDQTPGATAAFLQQLPLKPQASLILYINGAPGITVAPDASTIRNFAFGVRQVFYQVTTTSNPSVTNYPNGTSHTELEIVLGALHDIALPVNIHAGMNFNYDLSDCLINPVQGFLTVPSAVAGVPVNVTSVVEQIMAAGQAGIDAGTF